MLSRDDMLDLMWEVVDRHSVNQELLAGVTFDEISEKRARAKQGIYEINSRILDMMMSSGAVSQATLQFATRENISWQDEKVNLPEPQGVPQGMPQGMPPQGMPGMPPMGMPNGPLPGGPQPSPTGNGVDAVPQIPQQPPLPMGSLGMGAVNPGPGPMGGNSPGLPNMGDMRHVGVPQTPPTVPVPPTISNNGQPVEPNKVELPKADEVKQYIPTNPWQFGNDAPNENKPQFHEGPPPLKHPVPTENEKDNKQPFIDPFQQPNPDLLPKDN